LKRQKPLKLFRRAFLGLAVLSTLGFSAAATDEDRYNDLGGQFMCLCGCRQLLAGSYGCTMPACQVSGPMRDDLKKLIAEKKSDKEIRTAFVQKFGTTVLAAPTTTGFNLTAWIMPFAALAAGLLVVAYVARSWRARTPEAPASGPVDVKYQSRVEEELKKFTPED
jgi:cytochrome c-type biogenesis protein CcmH